MHDTVKARKLAYYGHTTNKQGSCLEKEIMQGRMPDARRRERPRTAWMNNIKTWTGLPVEESVRMTEDRIKLREYVHGVANTRIEDGSRTEQNRTDALIVCVCVSVGHDREPHEHDLTDQVAARQKRCAAQGLSCTLRSPASLFCCVIKGKQLQKSLNLAAKGVAPTPWEPKIT